MLLTDSSKKYFQLLVLSGLWMQIIHHTTVVNSQTDKPAVNCKHKTNINCSSIHSSI